MCARAGGKKTMCFPMLCFQLPLVHNATRRFCLAAAERPYARGAWLAAAGLAKPAARLYPAAELGDPGLINFLLNVPSVVALSFTPVTAFMFSLSSTSSNDMETLSAHDPD